RSNSSIRLSRDPTYSNPADGPDLPSVPPCPGSERWDVGGVRWSGFGPWGEFLHGWVDAVGIGWSGSVGPAGGGGQGEGPVGVLSGRPAGQVLDGVMLGAAQGQVLGEGGSAGRPVDGVVVLPFHPAASGVAAVLVAGADPAGLG